MKRGRLRVRLGHVGVVEQLGEFGGPWARGGPVMTSTFRVVNTDDVASATPPVKRESFK
jgi:hypothetical protein